MLVEEGAALGERHPERLVLVAVPADGGLDDEPALGEEVERAELAGEQQRMAQRRDHGARGEPQPVVAAAIAESRTSELGHGIAGSWLPGSA